MTIVEPYARLLDVPDRAAGIALLKKIEWCGRISHRAEDQQTDTSWDKFIRKVVLERGDWSIVEHASVTVDAVMDRGLTHEWVRHRLGSYTQESTRFVPYGKRIAANFIQPFSLSETASTIWRETIERCEAAYLSLYAQGVKAEIARSVFPNALASRIITTANLRNWRHVLLMRTTREVHPQLRQVTLPLLAEFQAKIPILFEDIVPEATQTEHLKQMC